MSPLLMLALACVTPPVEETPDTDVPATGTADSGVTDTGTVADTGDTGITPTDTGDTGTAPVDADGDGYPADEDCDDTKSSINPSATDLVGDGIDQNCDGVDGTDADGDGHPSEASGGEDCDDTDPGVHPDSADHGPDGVDQDCDGTDGPYLGEWPTAACDETPAFTGHDVGEVTRDFALMDQFGQDVHLEDFCGGAVLLLFDAMWNGFGNNSLDDLQDLWEDHRDEGLMVFGVYYEDQAGRSIEDPSVLADHAADHGVDFAVLSDPDHQIADRYWDQAIPHYVLLGAGLEVRHSGALPSGGEVALALPE